MDTGSSEQFCFPGCHQACLRLWPLAVLAALIPFRGTSSVMTFPLVAWCSLIARYLMASCLEVCQSLGRAFILMSLMGSFFRCCLWDAPIMGELWVVQMALTHVAFPEKASHRLRLSASRCQEIISVGGLFEVEVDQCS